MAEGLGLQVRDLARHFGGVQAVRGVNFSVLPGECVALIGPNGAGKSTTFACIAGQHAPSAGQVLWRGQRVDPLTPAQRLRLGMARTFQVAQTFEALTVLQNVQLLLPGASVRNPLQLLDTQAPQAALALLASVGLSEQAALDARQLPYGAKKRLELAMALAGLADTESTLLLLDEPAAGLAATERAALMQLVHGLTRAVAGRAGMAVLYTEHNMDAVFGVADRVLVLMEGRIVASGTAAEVAAHADVRRNYLGQSFRHTATPTEPGPSSQPEPRGIDA
ncbi:ABC transporter ATP-binding protein [Rhodoferax lacus]|uniref:ABC transporter ATP-binding protein n=1 Tax=Rhodoferax lacus TaxID=2184758 RepID=A0A3E1RIF1_9BURK|nr:ATP-binding cassette domain-containing protein [Rhodoferax lacus]RFO99021.1 ABC transporter ATP-binding protein [Rhodoferax lacus]